MFVLKNIILSQPLYQMGAFVQSYIDSEVIRWCCLKFDCYSVFAVLLIQQTFIYHLLCARHYLSLGIQRGIRWVGEQKRKQTVCVGELKSASQDKWYLYDLSSHQWGEGGKGEMRWKPHVVKEKNCVLEVRKPKI